MILNRFTPHPEAVRSLTQQLSKSTAAVMSQPAKAIIAGLIIGLLGLTLIPAGFPLEKNFGLALLFKLRGAIKAPQEAVIVTIDKVSADRLNLPTETKKWPRSVHAELIAKLKKRNAAVIIFDIFFNESKDKSDDDILTKAIKNAGNVILCERLNREIISLADGEFFSGELHIEKRAKPTAAIAQGAAASLPWPLPRDSGGISQYWTFKTAAGDVPTLPTAAFQLYALHTYDKISRSLNKSNNAETTKLPTVKGLPESGDLEDFIRQLLNSFRTNLSLGEVLRKGIKDTPELTQDEINSLESLIKMYEGPASLYLNYYGPPGTIKTLSLFEVLSDNEIDLSGKAVFVGLSERLWPLQKDGFHTVYSQENGLDLSGVEIAATAFANLLKNTPVQPVRPLFHMIIIFTWGMSLGILCRAAQPKLSLPSLLGLEFVYLFIALKAFETKGIWLPVIVPLLVQAPLAFIVAVTWKYVETNRERQIIRKAFGRYLPEQVVDELAKDLAGVQPTSRRVYGTCLFTDGQQYTKLSEAMDPGDLSALMNRYYKAVFEPVRRRGGIISDVVGDSMMALWTATNPDVKQKNQACLAAMDICAAVQAFNQSPADHALPIRIGLHAGYMALGNIGAEDHFEYRAVGDIVNTASRIEGLNKYLDTQCLISEDALAGLAAFTSRKLGNFLLAGKSRPVAIHELLCRSEDETDRLTTFCNLFSEARQAYESQSWEDAAKLFSNCLVMKPVDGPSLFYIERCKEFIAKPPDENWDGIMRISNK